MTEASTVWLKLLEMGTPVSSLSRVRQYAHRLANFRTMAPKLTAVAVIMPLAIQLGGGEMMFRKLVSRAPEGTVRWLAIFLEDGPMVEETRALGVRSVVVHAGRLRQPLRYLASVVWIAALVRRADADLVFSCMPKGHLYGGPAAALVRRPSAWYQLGLPSPPGWLHRLVNLLPTEAVLAVSEAQARAQSRLWPHHAVHSVHPGAELGRFSSRHLPSPASARRELGLAADGCLVGIVARLQRWKSVHVLVEAMPKVIAACSGARCVVVGGEHPLEPEYGLEVRRLVASLGLSERVTLAGQRSDVPRWMQAMDVVVHASDEEPFGIVVVEAMALGKPVVASAMGGPSEIISHGQSGLLVTPGDADALATAIVRYIKDPPFAARLAATGRERSAEFSAERYAAGVVAVLKGLAR